MCKCINRSTLWNTIYITLACFKLFRIWYVGTKNKNKFKKSNLEEPKSNIFDKTE